MSTFSTILCKQFSNVKYPSINNINLQYLNEIQNLNDPYCFCVKFIYKNVFLQYNSSKKTKFDILKEMVINNKGISSAYKTYYINKFTNAQKHYSNFRKLALICKFKSLKKYDFDTDMIFIPFDNLQQTILITLIENNIIYKFRISDLINVINKSLCNAPNFFSEPNHIRNPHTNLPFSVYNLYNIYFKLKTSNYLMPILFQQYFVSNFNITNFKNNNECLIRDKSICFYIANSDENEKVECIFQMLYSHADCVEFSIHQLFPKNRLVEVFNPFLKPYLLEIYSLNPYVKNYNHLYIRSELIRFSQLNPDFGKRIWIKRKRGLYRGRYYFTFNEIVNTNNQIIDSNNSSYLDEESDISDYAEENLNT